MASTPLRINGALTSCSPMVDSQTSPSQPALSLASTCFVLRLSVRHFMWHFWAYRTHMTNGRQLALQEATQYPGAKFWVNSLSKYIPWPIHMNFSILHYRWAAPRSTSSTAPVPLTLRRLASLVLTPVRSQKFLPLENILMLDILATSPGIVTDVYEDTTYTPPGMFQYPNCAIAASVLTFNGKQALPSSLARHL